MFCFYKLLFTFYHYQKVYKNQIHLYLMADEYGKKDGSQRGWKEGGGGRNRTDECRNPEIKEKREKEDEEEWW